MIDNNTISFGYGDILIVHESMVNSISFINIDTSHEIGSYIDLKDFMNNPSISIRLDWEKFKDFESKLKKVESGERIFELDGYTFDFTKYDKRSVEVVRRNLIDAMWFYILSMAC